MVVTGARTIRFGIRGIGGEIGDTVIRAYMAMKRGRFEAAKATMGGSLTAFIREKKNCESLNENIRADRSYAKLRGSGTLTDNTASSYDYAGVVSEVQFDEINRGRLLVVGADGRQLPIDYKVIPESNRGVPEFNEIDLLLEATGVGVKDLKKTPEQDPNFYDEYPGLTVLFSCPVKTVKGIPHLLAGLSLATPGKMNATGSCTTHAGVDVIRTIREGIISKMGLTEEDVIIDGGLLDTTHSLTPGDNNNLELYDGSYLPQTTGFGSAAATVYPVPGIGKIKAATGRYYSFHEKDGVHANGVSIYSLSMVVSVKKGSGVEVTQQLINEALKAAAADPEGRKHIGILSDKFVLDNNKKTAMMSGLSLCGMSPTVILPLGNNVEVVKTEATLVRGGFEFDQYTVTIKNAGYDNRWGFTVDLMQETNLVTQARFGVELIPGFHHQDDIGDRLAFVNSAPGQDMFARALELTGGNLLMNLAGYSS
ncbi:MAG: hypothetical protein WCV91_05340 [Candidatus Margulisiibacteriota bacterium]